MESLLKQIRKINKNNTFEGTVGIEVTDDDLSTLTLKLNVVSGLHQGADYLFRLTLRDGYLDSESPPFVTCCKFFVCHIPIIFYVWCKQKGSPIFHPNILQHGSVCLNLIKEEWQPGTTLEAIISMLYCLLDNPNFDNPLGDWRPKDFKKKKPEPPEDGSSSSNEDEDGNSDDESSSDDENYCPDNYADDLQLFIIAHYN